MGMSSHFHPNKILRDSTGLFYYILSRVVRQTYRITKTNTKG